MSGEAAELITHFPGLATCPFQITSPATVRYNCIAWAVGEAEKWIDPAVKRKWPGDVPSDGSVDSFIKLFVGHYGFALCYDGSPEPGFVKIAIYGDGYEFAHVARQLASGKWTSKLGCSF